MGHRPHQNLLRCALREADSGECHNPGKGTARSGHNFTAWTHCACHPSGVPRRWRRRCLTGRHRQCWSDDRRIPPARCPSAPQAREIPRPAPDACSAGTRNWGGAVRKVTAPPHHSAPRNRLSMRTRRLGVFKRASSYATSKSYWRNGSSRSTTCCLLSCDVLRTSPASD